jgi:azurin
MATGLATPCQHLLLFVSLAAAILTWWEESQVLICISFLAKDVKYFFVCVFIGHLYLF